MSSASSQMSLSGERSPRVELRPITSDNFETCLALSVADHQQGFVASNVYSIAESTVYPSMTPRAIYHGDELVGFVMFDRLPDPRDGRHWIHRLMIDAAHQGRGYGRAAMWEVLRVMTADPACSQIMIGYSPDNLVAKRLYASLGFDEIGIAPWGRELIARLHSSAARRRIRQSHG